MTIQEMHIAVELGLQKVASHQFDDFLPQEIDSYLNQAQLFFIKSRFEGARSFEQTRKRAADLHTVVENTVLGIPALKSDETFPDTPAHEYIVAYPDDYLFYVYAESGLTRSAHPVIEQKEYHPNVLGTHNEIPFYRVTSRNKPFLRHPVVIFEEDFIHIFADEETEILDQRLIYIRVPVPMNIGLDEDSNYSKELEMHCDLPDHVHPEIVDLTIALIKGDIQVQMNPVRMAMEQEQ